MGLRVDDEEVRDLIPLIRRATASTLYGVPAAAVYLLLVPLGVWLFDDLWTAGRIFFALAACVHALIFLSCRWSVGIRRKIEFQEVGPALAAVPAHHLCAPRPVTAPRPRRPAECARPLIFWSFLPRTAALPPFAACTWTLKCVAAAPASRAGTPDRPADPRGQGESFKAWFEFHKVKYMCDGPLDADKDVVFRRLDFPIAEPLAAYAGSRVRPLRLA